MKSIARDERQITLVYSGESRIGKMVRGYAAAIKDLELQTIDISKTKLTGTQWAEIAVGLNVTMQDLITDEEANIENENDEEAIKGDFDENSIIKILDHSPELLAYPVVIWGDRMMQIKQAEDIQQFIEVESAALEKTMMHEQPPIKSQSEGEEFVNKKIGK